MKIFLLTVLAISVVAGFKKCPAKIPKGLPKAPTSAKYYQLMRSDKEDKATCYNLNISGSGKEITIIQSMLFDNMQLEHIYIAKANANGTWDVTMNGNPSSEIYITPINNNIFIILSCEEKQALTVEAGAYSTSKKLSKSESNSVKEALIKLKIAEKNIVSVEASTCKN